MCSVDTWLYDKLVRICGFSTITYYEILWIHIGVELFTRPFLPLPSSPHPLGRVWEPNYLHA